MLELSRFVNHRRASEIGSFGNFQGETFWKNSLILQKLPLGGNQKDLLQRQLCPQIQGDRRVLGVGGGTRSAVANPGFERIFTTPGKARNPAVQPCHTIFHLNELRIKKAGQPGDRIGVRPGKCRTRLSHCQPCRERRERPDMLTDHGTGQIHPWWPMRHQTVEFLKIINHF
ncbi:MAG: hypothetical protein MUF86_14195 [Akkermansiaceae bacterium]|nr:hypothetical protein [Akkermansiaceae bacterium]